MNFMIFCYCFLRQILPSNADNAAYLLSANATQINMRKLRVNAQVTATTTTLETCLNVAFIIHLKLTKGTTASSIIHSMTKNMVIIPYVFLMNTAHNKDRIIEYGWQNVFKNLAGMACNTTEVVEITCKTDADKSSNKIVSDQSTNKKNKPGTSTSNEHINTQSSLEEADDCNLNAPHPNEVSPKASSSKFYNGVILNADELVKKEKRDTVVRTMLSYMISHIDREEQYIKCFKELLTFLDDSKNGRIISEHDLSMEFKKEISQNIPLRDKSGNKQTNIITTKTLNDTSSRICLEASEDDLLFTEDNSFYSKDNQNSVTERYGENCNRSLMRSVILQDLYSCYRDVDEFECVFERLIDSEESLVTLNNIHKEAWL